MEPMTETERAIAVRARITREIDAMAAGDLVGLMLRSYDDGWDEDVQSFEYSYAKERLNALLPAPEAL